PARFLPAPSAPVQPAVIAPLYAFVSVNAMFVHVVYSSPPHSYLHSFPTRRSSDLLMLDVPVTSSVPVWLTAPPAVVVRFDPTVVDRKSIRLNSSLSQSSYAVFCFNNKFVPATSAPVPLAVIAAVNAFVSVNAMFEP